MSDAERIVVLDVVGLEPRHLGERTPALSALLDPVATLQPPFPAVTVPSQTTLASGAAPEDHGDLANGRYDRETDTVEFWGRERGDRDRLWETASEAGLTTGALFFQHLVGTTADVAVTPSPIEDEDHILLEMDCWTNPDGLYDDLERALGHFPLHRFWGPGADETGSQWILDAAAIVTKEYDPDLLWVYVPHLDYEGLRTGPESEQFQAELATVDDLVADFLAVLREDGRWAETAVAVTSEYGFHTVDTPVFPNRALRSAGLLETAPDGDVALAESAAFALVDHQVAHVYTDALEATRDCLATLPGLEACLVGDQREASGVDHPAAGEIVLVAEPDAWFQYYWWDEPEHEPPYADSVDIHRKPGFDPCELFLDEDGHVSRDPTRVGGSHGRTDGTGCLGFGGPAAPATLPDTVDARTVAPTIASLLGLDDAALPDGRRSLPLGND